MHYTWSMKRSQKSKLQSPSQKWSLSFLCSPLVQGGRWGWHPRIRVRIWSGLADGGIAAMALSVGQHVSAMCLVLGVDWTVSDRCDISEMTQTGRLLDCQSACQSN